MGRWETPQHVLDARADWPLQLGYNAAEVAVVWMDTELAKEALGGELVDRVISDALFAFLGTAQDWDANV